MKNYSVLMQIGSEDATLVAVLSSRADAEAWIGPYDRGRQDAELRITGACRPAAYQVVKGEHLDRKSLF
jgi:hypothetical protein